MPVLVKEPFTGGRGSARGFSGRPSNSLSRSLACSMGHCLAFVAAFVTLSSPFSPGFTRAAPPREA